MLLVFCFLLVPMLGGCASAPQTAELLRLQSPEANTSRLLEGIPFFAQDRYQCGPAALATLLENSGVEITPEQLVPLVYVPDRKGSFQVELVAATRSAGRLAYEIPPTLSALFGEIDSGHPVLVLQNLGVGWYEKWHFAVVKGYDLSRHKVIMNSGVQENYEVSLRAFENTWARSKHWAMVALVPGIIPVSAEPSPYFNAVVALEKHLPAIEVSRAYSNGLRRWPDDRELLMGYGNLRYAESDLEFAKTLFARVAEYYPDYPPAHNNLAQVAFELGDFERAHASIHLAIALGGDYLATYQDTLKTIQEGTPKLKGSESKGSE